MSIIRLLGGLISLAKMMTGFFRDRRLIQAGEDRAIGRQNAKSLEIARKAAAARRAIAFDPGSLSNDPQDRDNR